MPRWTEEARQQQAERIRALCPWTKSTGPRTEEGKARSARNAWKGGVRADAAAYAKILRGIAATTRRLFSSFRQKHAFSPSTISQPPSTRPFSSFGRKQRGNVQHRTSNAQHRTCEGEEFILASIGDPLAVQSSGLSSDSLTANGTRMDANGGIEGQDAPAQSFSSFGRKQRGNAQHRMGKGEEPNGTQSCSVRSAEIHTTSGPANPFSSFGQNSTHQAPCSPHTAPSPHCPAPLPTDAELEQLSMEEFLAMAAGMLGGGLFGQDSLEHSILLPQP